MLTNPVHRYAVIKETKLKVEASNPSNLSALLVGIVLKATTYSLTVFSCCRALFYLSRAQLILLFADDAVPESLINMPPETGKTMLLELSKHMLSIPKSYLLRRVSHYESFNSLCRTTSTQMTDAKVDNYKDLEAIYKRIHKTLTLIRESRPDAKVQAQECLEKCQNYLGMINTKSVAELELKDSAKCLFSNINTNLEKLIEDSQEAKSGSKNLKKYAANYLADGFYRGGFERFIVEDDPYFTEIFGMHPVIHISFLQSGKSTFSSEFSAVRRCVQASFEEHSYLQEGLMYRGDEQSMKDLERFKKYLHRPEEVTEADFEQSMTFLSRLLNEEFQQNIVVLIDEYDASINAIVNRCPGAKHACKECLSQCYCFDKVNGLMKSFYTTLKQNKVVEKVLMIFRKLHHKYKYFLLNTADSVNYNKYTFPALAELSGALFGHVGAGSSLMVFQKIDGHRRIQSLHGNICSRSSCDHL
uniref:AAA-ATPase-like domain-containing protein n=1 Tax=Ditylenchus dipsaci TaxID=166011 RepID=A0A915EV85_9BILA